MRKFVIERNIPEVGKMDKNQLGAAAEASNAALTQLAPKVQWQNSYVTAEKTFCIYLAEDEQVIHQHAELSGFPANIITEVTSVIDPTTAG